MNRIEILRAEALAKDISYNEFFYKFYKAYEADENPIDEEKYAEAFYAALSRLEPEISEGELIVGKCGNILSEKEAEEWKNLYSDIAYKRFCLAGSGQDSHMAVDYDLLLQKGIKGVIADIEKYMDSSTEEKKPFYNSCKKCLEAVIWLSDRYSKEAERLADSSDDAERSKELRNIARICAKVPANGAESFYEAVQSVNFLTFCLSMNPYRSFSMQQFQLGRPDRYLFKYYEKDIQSGAITKERAQLLLDCLAIQINNRVPRGLSSGYMVGGRDKNNSIVENDLTMMCMQAIDDVRLVYPAVGFCYTEGMDERYLSKACEILSHGRSHPAIFNDDVIIKGLVSYGVPEDEAYDYIHSTCVEITPIAASNVWVASPYMNMPQLLLDILDREYESFEELLSVYLSRLDKSIWINFKNEDTNRKEREKNSINPLLSCFVNDCLKRGKDIEKGGAKFNWVMPSFVGMGNLVDSLYVIKEIVFEKKEYDIKGLRAVLERNFEGEEALRQKLLNSIPKYGNDIDEVDEYYGMITDHIVAECKKYKGYMENADLIPSVFCWIMHEQFGRKTGATPDGRQAGFPLGDGSGPCQGREMKGPTASILSSTKWDHHPFIGGVAVNMKFAKSSLGENSVKAMKELVKTYLSRGGFEIQINVVDKKTLEEAMISPDNYRDLVVRIGGYSDYFVKLSDEMQKEVILRTEHNL